MQACSRKLHLSPSISLEEFAKLTQGYSGADLQALMYNAHLDAIHTGLNAASEDAAGDSEKKKDQNEEIKFVEIGGTGGNGKEGGVRSKAEQAVVNKRVSKLETCCAFGIRTNLSLDAARANLGEYARVETVFLEGIETRQWSRSGE